MIKRYCDLCGKEIVGDGRIKVILTRTDQKPKTNIMPMDLVLSDDDMECYDVCSKCSTKLANYLGGLKGEK